ncbi:MAG TPA: hypothetical protein EYH08_04090 [Pyrodictium sp.]|nr:hypothetical protein [Pyrodictium sp.]
MCYSLHIIGFRKGVVINVLVAIVFLVAGLLSKGYCPASRAASPWYAIFTHNLVFAGAITLLTCLLEAAGILLASSTVGFTMFTCGRAITCGSLSATLVAILEATAYMLAYITALVKTRWRIALASIVLAILLVASVVESQAV